MAKKEKEPKPELKKAAETPKEQPAQTEPPASIKSDIRIFIALCR